ncbi:MAG: hypothetical protein U0941_14925 [Planctomycetaceae bacterium]
MLTPVQPSSPLRASDIREGIVCRIRLCDAKSHNTLSTSEDTHFTIDGGAMLYPEIIAPLWERMIALPVGEQSRCHDPGFCIQINQLQGFRIAAICRECNNISICVNGSFFWQIFDAQSAVAKEFLSDLQSFVA